MAEKHHAESVSQPGQPPDQPPDQVRGQWPRGHAPTRRKTGGPIGGTPESAAWFRQALEALGETQSSMARLMHRKGDDRQPTTILRTIQRMATGEARVSGEMRVILTMMRRAKERGERRTTEKRESPGIIG